MDGVRVTRSVTIPASELRFRFARSGGPGGQNVNKRNTQVELLFDLSGSPSLGPRQKARAMRRLANRLDADGTLRIVATEARTQGANREAAVERFRALMADALRPPPRARRATKPSRAARERRLQTKRLRGRQKRERAWKPSED